MNIPFVWSCALVNTSIYSSYVGIVMMLSLHTVSCNLIFCFLFTLHFSALLFIIIRQFYLFISCVFIKMMNSIIFTHIVVPMEQFIVLQFLYQFECFEAIQIDLQLESKWKIVIWVFRLCGVIDTSAYSSIVDSCI